MAAEEPQFVFGNSIVHHDAAQHPTFESGIWHSELLLPIRATHVHIGHTCLPR
jgi:hypothetical protein